MFARPHGPRTGGAFSSGLGSAASCSTEPGSASPPCRASGAPTACSRIGCASSSWPPRPSICSQVPGVAEGSRNDWLGSRSKLWSSPSTAMVGAAALPWPFRSPARHRVAEARRGGPLNVAAPRARAELADAFIEAAIAEGFPRNPDYNNGNQEGFGYFQATQEMADQIPNAL
jgi:hypothetical protein